MKKKVLGLIGGSDGNGHPFSWSAICNGYNPKSMRDSGYPIISKYLGEKKWPDAQLQYATVDYVYTQSKGLSNLIANATKIQNIVEHPDEMIGKIDGLLLARDDAENHLKYANAFLKAHVPVFIDKPIALSSASLKELWSMQNYDNQIFSCSALSHAFDDQEYSTSIKSIGKIREIKATTPNSWNKYGVHIVEPLIKYCKGLRNFEALKNVSQNKGSVKVSFINEENIKVELMSLGPGAKSEISFYFRGDLGEVKIYPNDYFSYFKKSLERFISNIFNRSSLWECSFKHHRSVVNLLEMGAY